MKLTKHNAVTCAKCGRVDVGHRDGVMHVTGTAQMMRCRDCGDWPDISPRGGYAQLCRMCCPTRHGTRFPQATTEENR